MDNHGVLTLPVAGGGQTALPGGVVSNFSRPALNISGVITYRVSGSGRGGLLYGDARNPSFVLFENHEVRRQSINSFRTFPDSLTSEGDVLFATYTFDPTGNTSNGEGLFVYSPTDGQVRSIFALQDGLPDGARNDQIVEAGIADDGAVYFFAGYQEQGIYRLARGLAETRKARARGRPDLRRGNQRVLVSEGRSQWRCRVGRLGRQPAGSGVSPFGRRQCPYRGRGRVWGTRRPPGCRSCVRR